MIKETIEFGKTYLGMELGSTRIKAVLTDESFNIFASGNHEWQNRYENGYWTYTLDDIHNGVKEAYSNLKRNVYDKYGVSFTTTGAIGISAMMHGYLVFDKDYNLLTPFRTWRNTTTEEAAQKLSEVFEFNIPQRWSIAHLYQAILDNEPHVSRISHITTLAGYIHYLLTGRFEVGIGDASGIFPVIGNEYNAKMLDSFDLLVKEKSYPWKIRDILPNIRRAGEKGAYLTQDGVKVLDSEAKLVQGIPVCPPEGDAGTGMVATNSVLPKTGNVSAGTSAFAMLVLEKSLNRFYSQIDIVSTPDGSPVAMVHCNNCCGELDTWVNIFEEFSKLFGCDINKSELYSKLYNHALTTECTEMVSYNYLSGEHITGIKEGMPMFYRNPETKLSLAGFIKSQLFSSIATLKLGMDILMENEVANADDFFAHGGLFKVTGVAQQILADALEVPVSVMDTLGEGGAWGAAILAGYMMNKNDVKLGDWLAANVFSGKSIYKLSPCHKGTLEFKEYMKNYVKGLCMIRKMQEENNDAGRA